MNVHNLFRRSLLLRYFIRAYSVDPQCMRKPSHLICFKEWTAEMVMDIIHSAINFKTSCSNPYGMKLDLLDGYKVMTLLETNEPILNLAVSKAATMLGAQHVTIIDELSWNYDYLGTVFSLMCDAIFVSTKTHFCVQRLANKSLVPVLCMMSRTHASIQSMSTIMAVLEEFGTLSDLNFAYLGKYHQSLNSYLLLCPMLGANIRFKCCCNKTKVTPLLFKASEELCMKTHTDMKACDTKEILLQDAHVVIAGPTPSKDKISEFQLTAEDLSKPGLANPACIFFHTLPKGDEVDDELFNGYRSRTCVAFQNMVYIAAALLAKAIKGHVF